jgi:hypothetical protein
VPCLQGQGHELDGGSLTHHVMSAMSHAGTHFSNVLQRPGMLAAAAAVDADAAPALCILLLASHEAYPAEARCELSHMRSLLQPATTECLRSVQGMSLQHWPLCWLAGWPESHVQLVSETNY